MPFSCSQKHCKTAMPVWPFGSIFSLKNHLPIVRIEALTWFSCLSFGAGKGLYQAGACGLVCSLYCYQTSHRWTQESNCDIFCGCVPPACLFNSAYKDPQILCRAHPHAFIGLRFVSRTYSSQSLHTRQRIAEVKFRNP